MTPFRRVIIESPYRGLTPRAVQRNIQYAIAAMKDSINRGEAPFLSHLLYTNALDDRIQSERELGIVLGYTWWSKGVPICFYCDLGWTEGMVNAKLVAQRMHIRIEERYVAKDLNQDY